MKEWNELLEVANVLFGEPGCAWTKAQTLSSLEPYLLEEMHELIEAIDLGDPIKMKEEIGDVLYTLIFASKINEKEGRFAIEDAIRAVKEKLIRRHPHVFANLEVESLEAMWEDVKKKEGKKNPIDGIPPALPALARAQKVIQKLRKSEKIQEKISDDIGQKLWDLVREAENQGVDAESALRRVSLAYEEKHRR